MFMKLLREIKELRNLTEANNNEIYDHLLNIAKHHGDYKIEFTKSLNYDDTLQRLLDKHNMTDDDMYSLADKAWNGAKGL